MSVYNTLSRPVVGATGEQRCMKLTFVLLASIRVPESHVCITRSVHVMLHLHLAVASFLGTCMFHSST